MAANPEAYAAVIQDLLEQRTRIDDTIKALERFMASATAPTVAAVDADAVATMPPSVPVQNLPKRIEGRFGGMTIIDASMQVLKEADGPMHIGEITNAVVAGGVVVTGDAANTVGSILARRGRDKGDVKRIGRGTWALASYAFRLDDVSNYEDPMPDEPGFRNVDDADIEIG